MIQVLSNSIQPQSQTRAIQHSIVGQQLAGRYQIIDHLSRGGFSETYIAEDTHHSDQHYCVVKHLKPLTTGESNDLEDTRRRFDQEAEILEKLGHHDQIPRLLAYFEENGEFYLVQEFIEGHSLRAELTAESPWTESQVMQLLQEVLNVLEFVHSQGVIHRDVKPENLIRRDSDGCLVLIDFGAVKPLQPSTAPDQENITIAVSSEGYTPIEQIRGKPCLSSDLYALGMICIEALTGSHPREFEERLHAAEISWADPVNVSPGLVAVLVTMTRHHWKNRYQTAAEVLQRLQRLVDFQSSDSDGIDQTGDLTNDSPAPGVLNYTPTQVTPAQSEPKLCVTLPSLKGVLPKQPNPTEQASSTTEASSDEAAANPSPRQTRDKISVHQMLRRYGITNLSKVLSFLVGVGMIASGATILACVGAGWMPMQRQESSVLSAPLSEEFLTHVLEGRSLQINAIAIAPNGEVLVSANADNTLQVWDLEAGQSVQTLVGHFGAVSAVAISADGQLLASGGEDAKINIWSLESGKLLQTLRGHQWSVRSVAFSPDGETLVSSSEDGTIRLWNLKTGEVRQTLAGFKASFTSIDISPDGSLLVGGSADNTIKVWNVHTGDLLHTLRGHSDSVRSVAVSSDGVTLASGSADHTVKLWNLYTGELLRTLEGHAAEVYAVAIAPDGQTVVSGSADHTLRLWDVRTGELLHTLRDAQSEVQSVAFHPNGRTLASSSLNGTLKLWRIPARNQATNDGL